MSDKTKIKDNIIGRKLIRIRNKERPIRRTKKNKRGAEKEGNGDRKGEGKQGRQRERERTKEKVGYERKGEGESE